MTITATPTPSRLQEPQRSGGETYRRHHERMESALWNAEKRRSDSSHKDVWRYFDEHVYKTIPVKAAVPRALNKLWPPTNLFATADTHMQAIRKTVNNESRDGWTEIEGARHGVWGEMTCLLFARPACLVSVLCGRDPLCQYASDNHHGFF